MGTSQYYRILDHPADLYVEVWGKNFKQLLMHIAYALREILVSNLGLKIKQYAKEFYLEGDEIMRAKNFIAELLYQMYDAKIIVSDIIDVRQQENSLYVKAEVEVYDTIEYIYEAKAVTYHNLKIWREKRDNMLHITFVIDL